MDLGIPTSTQPTELKTRLSEQLRQDLPAIVNRLNNQRGLWARIRGENYEFIERDENSYAHKFIICVSDKKTRTRRGGMPVVADIILRSVGSFEQITQLDGFVPSDKRYSVIRDYVHTLSHQHPLPLSRSLAQYAFLMHD